MFQPNNKELVTDLQNSSNNNPTNTSDNHENDPSFSESTLRLNSLVLASYPWTTTTVMCPNSLSESMENNHYAFVCIFALIIERLISIDF